MSRTNCTRLVKDNSQPRAPNIRMVKDIFYLSIFKYFYFWAKMVNFIQRFVTRHFRRFFKIYTKGGSKCQTNKDTCSYL